MAGDFSVLTKSFVSNDMLIIRQRSANNHWLQQDTREKIHLAGKLQQLY